MNPTQCKMARAALGWSIKELAAKCSASPNTIYRYENGKDAYTSTASKIEQAFLDTGKVRFDGDCCVCVKQGE